MFRTIYEPKAYNLIPESLIFKETVVCPKSVIFDEINGQFVFFFSRQHGMQIQTYRLSFREILSLQTATAEPLFRMIYMRLIPSSSKVLHSVVNPEKLPNQKIFYLDIVMTLCLSDTAFQVFIAHCQKVSISCYLITSHTFFNVIGHLCYKILYRKGHPSANLQDPSDDEVPDINTYLATYTESSVKADKTTPMEESVLLPDKNIELPVDIDVSSNKHEQHENSDQYSADIPKQEFQMEDEIHFSSETEQVVYTQDDMPPLASPSLKVEASCSPPIIDSPCLSLDVNTPVISPAFQHPPSNIPSSQISPNSVPCLISQQKDTCKTVTTAEDPVVIEDLSSDEDEHIQPKGDVKVKFKDGSLFTIPRETMENIGPTTWLNDIIVDFYMDHLYKDVLTDEDRKHVHIFHTSFFMRLSRLKNCLNRNIEGSSHEIEQSVNSMLSIIYPTRKSRSNIGYINKSLLMVPVFWENHWLLAVIHGLNNLFTVNTDRRCRIIIIDSKMKDPANAKILISIHSKVFHIIRRYAELMVYTQLNRIPRADFTCIRCMCLPDQSNSYDCGLYMIKYIEVFSKNREFLELSDNDIQLGEINYSAVEFQRMIDKERATMSVKIMAMAVK